MALLRRIIVQIQAEESADERIAVNLTHTHTHTSGCHTHIWSFTTLFQWFSACGDKHAAALTSTESRLVSLDQRSSESSLNMSRLNSGTKQHLFSCVKGDVCLKITAVFKTAY